MYSPVRDRFDNLNRTRYSTGSMATYKSRFRQAVTMYLAWLDKDPGWKKPGSPRPARPANRTAASSNRKAIAPRTSPSDQPAAHPILASQRLIAYDLPLRPDLLVRFTLPVDLTPEDAQRIAAFVRSLAFDPATEISASPVHSTTETQD